MIMIFFSSETSKNILIENGFEELKEKEEWKLEKGKKYFFTRGMSTIVAFAIGKNYDSNGGFSITAAHTDSPCLKIKPKSKIKNFDINQVGVQVYGGGLWHTWFDRDLGVSGLVLIKKNDVVTSKVVNITKPILRIPTLAIHLNREVNESFTFNRELNLIPILSTEVKTKKRVRDINNNYVANHHMELIDIIADECGCEPEEICGLDLSLCDAQDGALGGINEEFIFSGRLDNLMMSWCCLDSLIQASTDKNLENESNTYLCILFDNEEVGSLSTNGANSTVMESTMQRIAKHFNNNNVVDLTIPIKKSFLFSCDMAHGIHPNYSNKHESNHQPQFHKGPVIKVNANQRYATSIESTYITKALAEMDKIPYQEFVVRNDMGCGSTIGPILAGRLGMRCVDIGIPQYSMHSIREMAGTADLVHSTKLLVNFYKHFSKLDQNIKID